MGAPERAITCLATSDARVLNTVGGQAAHISHRDPQCNKNTCSRYRGGEYHGRGDWENANRSCDR